MGRAPCCDKVGLKKGPWTPEEDQILISFIQQHGHSNWRALPKQAGLLRCGKSCRLRWINYLKPDIKRGNFSKEEEDTIIQLHEMMGNRWSAIAARLPGRTDNEIKNVWHTHLKKRLKEYQPTNSRSKSVTKKRHIKDVTTPTTTESTSSDHNPESIDDQIATSPQQSYTISDEFSSVTDALSVENPKDAQVIDTFDEMTSLLEYFPIIDDTFWESQELLPLENNDNNYKMGSEVSNMIIEDHQFEREDNNFATVFDYSEDNLDFWLDVFVQADGAQQLPNF